jgi:hypothetical protein
MSKIQMAFVVEDGTETCTNCGKRPVIVMRGGPLDGKASAVCAQCFVEGMDELLDQVPPETDEEIDAELREAGYDPDQVAAYGIALAEHLAKQYAPKAN